MRCACQEKTYVFAAPHNKDVCALLYTKRIKNTTVKVAGIFNPMRFLDILVGLTQQSDKGSFRAERMQNAKC